MLELLEVCELGNPVLRQRSHPIQHIHDSAVQTLIDDLLATLHLRKGVGIAAPQVGVPYRLLIVASHPNDRYPHAPIMKPTVMINPEILSYSGEKIKDWEGCLSIPGIRGLVPRYSGIILEYMDRRGGLHKQEFHGFIARIIQHEFDHLDGIVFLDRVETTRELISDQEYQKLIQKQG